MNPITLSIKDCINIITGEVEQMRFGPRDAQNAGHAQRALGLLDSLRAWAEQAEKEEAAKAAKAEAAKADEGGQESGEPDAEAAEA